MSKISVLEIIGDSSLAGAPRHLLSILENLDRDNFEVYSICPPGPLAGEIRDIRRKVEVEVIAMKSRSDLVAIEKIRKYIKHIKPDVIHIHGTRAGSLGRLASIGLGKPVIYTEHLWTKDFNLDNSFLNYIHHMAGWFLDLFTTLNLAVSESVKEFMIHSHISYADKIEVVYNGIEPTKSKADIFVDHKEFKLGTIGTLIPVKGIQYLIQALPIVRREFPEVKLEIIGEGPYKKSLVKEVKRRKLEKYVIFSGFQAEIEKSLMGMDMYIQPSISESFGLAIVQAMSVGLPIVATNAGGIPEVISDGKTGLLVAPGKPKELATAIIKILRDRTLAHYLGDNARKESVVRFNLKDMIDQVENIYAKVVKNPLFPE
jgi:glycosyltransferase involved in cell wall biosynthesis